MAVQEVLVTSTGLPIQAAGNSASDAFGRFRVSTPYSEFDNKQLYDKNPLLWAEFLSGGATSVHSAPLAQVTMTVPALAAASIIRQTKQRFNYQTGKGMLISLSGSFNGAALGVTKRTGFYDVENGVFFQVTGSGVAVGIRSSVTGFPIDTVIPQALWNIDRLDGSGKSGVILDLLQQQVFLIDFQWFGAGRVRFGFYINGMAILCHEIDHANISSVVYMSTPNLPCRWEVSNNGTGPSSSALSHGCVSVISEAGFDQIGIIRSIDRGISGRVTGAGSTANIPLLSMRLKATQTGSTIIPLAASIISTTNGNFRWSLVLNPTIAGVDAAVWISLPDSSIEYDISRSIANVVSGGTQVASGYAHAPASAVMATLASSLTLGQDLSGVQDQFVLTVQNLVSANDTYFGSLTFRELQ
jgi:hypothetical protein